MKSETQKEAAELVSSFMKKGMISSRRNKMGNVVWPLHKKCFQGIMVASSILAFSSVPLAATLMAGSFMADRLLSSHIKFLQNMTLANAAHFGRNMVAQNVPEAVRHIAMEKFLHKAGPWFTATRYIHQNPEMVARLENGQMVPRLVSLSDIIERRLNRELRTAERMGRSMPSFKDRLNAYKEAFHEFRVARMRSKQQSLTQRFEESMVAGTRQDNVQSTEQNPQPLVVKQVNDKSAFVSKMQNALVADRKGKSF